MKLNMALNAIQTALRASPSALPSSCQATISQRLPPLPSIRDIVKLYKLRAIKQLSQNFLLDEKLTGKICKVAGRLENLYVCEVGPGPGGITRSILSKNPKKLILIEKDKRFSSALTLLQESCPAGTVDIYWGDVLSFEMSKLFPQEAYSDWNDKIPPIHIIGNLPFSVSSPLLVKWLAAISQRSNAWSFGRVPLTLTFQKEIAERLIAAPMQEQRSRLSIMAQHLCHCDHKFTIPGSAFVPKPDVDVGVVKFIPRKVRLIEQDFFLVEKVVRQTFCMRQKYCRRGVATLFPEIVRAWFTQDIFKRSGVVSTRRPFELTMEEFSSLCNAYAEICKEYPSLRDYNYRGFRPEEEWETMYAHAFGDSFKMEKSTFSDASPDPLDVDDENDPNDPLNDIHTQSI